MQPRQQCTEVHRDVREGMPTLFEELGCRVLLADGSARAGQHAHGGMLDMVICDIRLKVRSDGLKMIGQYQAIQPGFYALLISSDTTPDRLKQVHSAQIPMLHKSAGLNERMRPVHLAKVEVRA